MEDQKIEYTTTITKIANMVCPFCEKGYMEYIEENDPQAFMRADHTVIFQHTCSECKATLDLDSTYPRKASIGVSEEDKFEKLIEVEAEYSTDGDIGYKKEYPNHIAINKIGKLLGLIKE